MPITHWQRTVWLLAALVAVCVFAYSISSSLSAAYDGLLHWIFAKQREFHQSMTSSLSALADNQGVGTAYAVVAGSFLYGVFHAAGPGHGKVVLSTYLLAEPESVRKSLAMAVAAAALQGLVAIILVYGLFFVFGMVPKDSRVAALWSERLSYGLVMAIGLWLLWRAARMVRSTLAIQRLTNSHSHEQHHGHSHHDNQHSAHHDHSHDHGHHHHHHHHHHHGEGEVCNHCGHAHLPDAGQVAKAVDFRSILGVIFSIGLRPCSGAILVLVFAKFASIPMAGVMAVIAMSAGTAITVATLALVAVKGRDVAQRLLGTGDGVAVWFSSGTAALGGVVLLVLGYGLLAGSFDAPVRSMGLG